MLGRVAGRVLAHYPLYLANLGLEARFVPVDPLTLRLDPPAIAAALGPRTVALLLLMQPTNPSGLLHDQAELLALVDLLHAAPRPPLLTRYVGRGGAPWEPRNPR